MQTSLKWAGDVAFVARSGSGHKVVIDGPPEGGGRDLGPRPMEMILMGLGALDGKRADTIPSVFIDIHIRFLITGHGVSAEQVEKAIHLSAEKYCSASIMLGKTAKITHSFQITEAD